MPDSLSRSAAPRPTLRLLLLACAAIIAIAAACDEPSGTPRPSPSLIELDFTPLPTITAGTTAGASAAPTLVRRPTGWDTAFCELATDAVVAQELLVDIERAMDEDALRDARLLANELTLVAGHASELVPTIPDWPPGEDALRSIAVLMDLDEQAAAEYTTYFENGRRRVLRRARALREDAALEVPGANEELQRLAEIGVLCPGITLELESP